MPRVDMMLTLNGFDAALKAKKIGTTRMRGDERIHVHEDMPAPRTPRLTYARLKGAHVTAVAVVTVGDPVDGVPCVHIGYAVREDQRGNGRAKELMAAAIRDFAENMGKKGLKEFWVEASIDDDNAASIAVARSVLGVDPTDQVDDTEEPPVPIKHFLKSITTT